MHARKAIVIAGVFAATTAAAQPAPGTDTAYAKSLMQSGVKLLEAKDYLGALAVFKEAYARLKNAKILLNIGTTLKLLDRRADAANAYQHYLDSADTDPARRAEVVDVIADLDRSVGRVALSVTPPDAEVQFTDEWVLASAAKVWRVAPGSFTAHARKDGFKPDAKSGTIAAGNNTAIVINLEAIPEVSATPLVLTAPRGDTELLAPAQDVVRSRFGAIAGVHVSVLPRIGSALLIGGTIDLTEQLSLDAALMLGPGLVSKGMTTLPPPSYGAYLGASFAFSSGNLRPRVSGGIPVFASDGARFALRGAGGIEYLASKQFSLTLDVGAEISVNPEDDIHKIAVVPALGATGRL